MRHAELFLCPGRILFFPDHNRGAAWSTAELASGGDVVVDSKSVRLLWPELGIARNKSNKLVCLIPMTLERKQQRATNDGLTPGNKGLVRQVAGLEAEQTDRREAQVDDRARKSDRTH